MKHSISRNRIKWIPVRESLMDGVKSAWKKVKDAFSDRPKVILKGENGETEEGYLHDLNKKKGTFTLILAKKEEADESAVAAAVASAMAARGSERTDNGKTKKEQKIEPKFSKGDKVEVLGAFPDKVQGEILGFDTYADISEYQVKILNDGIALEEGRETNPRFKCMEENLKEENKMINEELDIDDIYENKAWYEITLQDENGEIDEEQIDVTEEDYWGNINTVDGTCYFPSGEEFDGIGYGNDEDGYRKIVQVVDINTGRKVPLQKWADFVDSLVELFSDM